MPQTQEGAEYEKLREGRTLYITLVKHTLL